MGPFGSLWGHYSLQTASEVKLDHRFEISDPNYLLIHVHIVYMVLALLAASEATTASKQPQRSEQSLQVKLVTPIYYNTTFQGTFISQKMTWFPGGGEWWSIDLRASPQVKSIITKVVRNILTFSIHRKNTYTQVFYKARLIRATFETSLLARFPTPQQLLAKEKESEYSEWNGT